MLTHTSNLVILALDTRLTLKLIMVKISKEFSYRFSKPNNQKKRDRKYLYSCQIQNFQRTSFLPLVFDSKWV